MFRSDRARHFPRGSRAASGIALLAALLVGGPATGAPTPAQPVAFEETAVLSPLDFFEDWSGVLDDGGPGEPSLWTPLCGSFDDLSVSGGRLAIEGPDAACGGAILASTFGVPGPMTVRASFEWDVPPLGQTRSLTVANQAGTDLVAIAVNRDDLSSQNLPPDTTLVALAVEDPSGFPVPVLFQPISFDTANDAGLLAFQAIEFRLTLTDAGDGTLDTLAEYRLCLQKDPCESEATTPFIALNNPIPMAPIERLPLAAGEAHGPALAVLDAAPFTVHALDLSLESDGYGDDYEDGAFDPSQHVFLCGTPANVSEAEGALTLDRTGTPCGSLQGVQVGRAAAFPGPQVLEATLPFTIPDPCTTYGVTLGSASANFGADFVNFSIYRLESDPDVVVLGGVAEPVAEGPALPTFARSEIDVAGLAEDGLLQLRLALLPDGEALAPALSYRVCPAPGCPDEGTLPFTALADGEACPTEPPGEVCPGLAAAEFCAPEDGGAVGSPEPLSYTVFAVPEPGSAAAWAAAALALAACGRRRRAPPAPGGANLSARADPSPPSRLARRAS